MDQDLVTDAGKPFVMAVPYNAYPHAEAEWFYDNISLPKDNLYTTPDKAEYRLKDPKKSDEGRYKIIIKNKHGQGEAFINLKVIGEFVFVIFYTLLYKTILMNLLYSTTQTFALAPMRCLNLNIVTVIGTLHCRRKCNIKTICKHGLNNPNFNLFIIKRFGVD